MNQNSRSKNFKTNVIWGIASQFLITLLQFVARIIFVRMLSAEYLGVNGLYSNILSILSMAELGVSNVLNYSLYKPVRENNQEKINQLLNFYQKLYLFIASFVAIVGICLLPVLKFIINSNLPYNELIEYYFLYLLNSVVSYFVVYKTALINADQKNYIIKVVNIIILFVQYVLQIIILLWTSNYLIYLSLFVLCTILNNVVLNTIANRLYPFIKNHEKTMILQDEKKNLFSNLKATFLYKISVVIINSTDNILISIICGTIFVGYYSNYNMIVTAIMTFINIIITSLISSLGNLNAEGNKKRSYDIFNTLILMFAVLTTWCTGCMLAIFTDFITMAFGTEYSLNNIILFAVLFNFYLQNIINPVWMYRETMGLFKQIKYIMLITACINIITSFVLGKIFGLAGILYATGISRLLTTVWYEPRLLYRTKFSQPVINYWKMQGKLIAVALMDIIFIYIMVLITPKNSIIFMIVKLCITTMIVLVSFSITNRHTKEYKIMKQLVMNLFLEKFLVKINRKGWACD
ncbi:lipopolysaccharide biosynthesis protein [Clostridium sp. PL3]|uniref:Lipopolysaccharide biosynthesis protein n=1 Tax=Clostridium thailandense TaxID=2794346 RepID=A0A949TUB0_9CLOT|nr:lipopolysaccharide biosynthesis protein [Clostridium thailandense]MBV7271525.1 lipopolysaccharide biosynthesis protein [Clostridium thailandense]